mgnify:CR=1 FL=1
MRDTNGEGDRLFQLCAPIPGGALYCIWDATDSEAILEVLAKAAPDLPTEGPYKIEMDIHSEDFR